MARCANCKGIIFGGKSDGEDRYCGDKCLQAGQIRKAAGIIPPDIVAEHVVAVHQGECPKCGKPGPVDIHTSHFIWSLLLLTSWNSTPEICCNSCGTKKKIGSAVGCFFTGWWGFPWGILGTPVQIVRNFAELGKRAHPEQPSEQLTEFVKVMLAQQILLQRQQPAQPTTAAKAPSPRR